MLGSLQRHSWKLQLYIIVTYSTSMAQNILHKFHSIMRKACSVDLSLCVQHQFPTAKLKWKTFFVGNVINRKIEYDLM